MKKRNWQISLIKQESSRIQVSKSFMKKLRKVLLHPEVLEISTVFFSFFFLLKFINFQLINISIIFEVSLSSYKKNLLSLQEIVIKVNDSVHTASLTFRLY